VIKPTFHIRQKLITGGVEVNHLIRGIVAGIAASPLYINFSTNGEYIYFLPTIFLNFLAGLNFEMFRGKNL